MRDDAPRAPAGAERMIHIIQGEHRVERDPSVKLTTLLGSCVAACINDPTRGVGGMNHFLLPGDLDQVSRGSAERYAVHLMELLVNALLRNGATRNRLEAKVFGGAATIQGVTDVGALNAKFAVEFLEAERIAIVAKCLGGSLGRKIQYWPSTGRARRVFMDYAEKVAPRPTIGAECGKLELF